MDKAFPGELEVFLYNFCNSRPTLFQCSAEGMFDPQVCMYHTHEAGEGLPRTSDRKTLMESNTRTGMDHKTGKGMSHRAGRGLGHL